MGEMNVGELRDTRGKTKVYFMLSETKILQWPVL